MLGRRDSPSTQTGMSERPGPTYRNDSRDPRLQRQSPSFGTRGQLNDTTSTRKDNNITSREDSIKSRRGSTVDTDDSTNSGFKDLQEEQSRPFGPSKERAMSSDPVHHVASTTSSVPPTTVGSETTASTFSGLLENLSGFPGPTEISRTIVIADDVDDPITCNLPLDGTGKICAHVLPGVRD